MHNNNPHPLSGYTLGRGLILKLILMAYPLNEKVIEKWRKEDIELHKRVILNYLYEMGVSLSNRKKFFILYDHYITPKNILCYINRPIKIFVRYLILNRLDEICDIYPTVVKVRKPRKRRQ